MFREQSSEEFLLTYGARSAFLANRTEEAIEKASSAISLYRDHRTAHISASETKSTDPSHSALSDPSLVQLSDTERKAHDWLVLALTSQDRHLEAMLLLEQCFDKIVDCNVGRSRSIQFAHGLCEDGFTVDNLIYAVNDLNSPMLKYHVIPVETDITYLVIWLVLPAGFTDDNRMKVICSKRVLSYKGDSDVRQWLSKCRVDLGLSGWKWTDRHSFTAPTKAMYESASYHPLLQALSSEQLLRKPAGVDAYISQEAISASQQSVLGKSSWLFPIDCVLSWLLLGDFFSGWNWMPFACLADCSIPVIGTIMILTILTISLVITAQLYV
jgi:hypothetical protein